MNAIVDRTESPISLRRPITLAATDRLRGLDVVRGLAAIAVVVFHWQHMYMIDGPVFDRTSQPLFAYLGLIYGKGWMAVDLFFCISGFVFSWLYLEKIEYKKISLARFMNLRISRLYPLHLATLIAITLLQVMFYAKTNGFFVIKYNDSYHFVLHLFFINSWGFERGSSFNEPLWSVSVEMLLYLLFFGLCRKGFGRHATILLALVVAGILVSSPYGPIGRGLVGFFMGCLVFHLFDRVSRRGLIGRSSAGLALLGAALLWSAVLTGWGSQCLTWAEAALGMLSPAAAALFARKAGYLSMLYVTVLVFPATVFAIVAWETAYAPNLRRIAWLGDISYASYLLHFPLQLLVLALAVVWGLLPAAAAQSGVALGLFLVGISLLSWWTYTGFELPAQRALRRAFQPRPQPARPGLAAAEATASNPG